MFYENAPQRGNAKMKEQLGLVKEHLVYFHSDWRVFWDLIWLKLLRYKGRWLFRNL
ncbi:MAG TPA: hypothetical protein VL859_14390 [Flavobacterium sp.]|nr:hypothetical protein [Flavobacterium sp.]